MTFQPELFFVAGMAAGVLATGIWVRSMRRKLQLLQSHVIQLEQDRRQAHFLVQEARRQIERLQGQNVEATSPNAYVPPRQAAAVTSEASSVVRQTEGSLFIGRAGDQTDFMDTLVLDGFPSTSYSELP